MATLHFTIFILLLFLSTFALLLLTHLQYGIQSFPFQSPPAPSCDSGQSWAVRLHADPHHEDELECEELDVIANQVAEQAGLHNQGQIGHLEGHYLLCSSHPGANVWRNNLHPGKVLANHPNVLWYSQERVLSRSKRSMAFNDPHYPKQWHLHNGVNKDMDINVTGIWEHNITGQGVTVVVVDDGVQHTHKDLKPNYSPEGSYDLNSNDPDPMPHPDVHSDNHHGTRCAGEIAAVPNNSFCAVGVAYGSKVAGIRVLDGPLTDSLEAIAFNKHYQVNDIYSCSWGPDDDGHTVDGPHPLGKVTSDWFMQQGTGCTESHTGTSAAAPLAAGMVALMLQVRPCLGWRDVQHIIAFTATKCDNSSDWRENGAGFHHSHQHGFGLLNAWKLVNAAKIWEPVPFLVSYQSSVFDEKVSIPSYPKELVRTWKVTAADLALSGMRTLEHVAVTVTITHPCRGNLEIVLFCPSGIPSVIGARRAIDRDSAGYQDWTFSTVRCWGERADGQYYLKLSDHKEPSSQQCASVGELKQWKLTLYGSSLTFKDVKDRQMLVRDAMSGKYLHSNFSLPCSPGLDIPSEMISPFTSSSLRFLLLLGCFALFWSLYYILEAAMAHLDLRCLQCLSWRKTGHRVRNGRRVEEALDEEDEGSQERESGVELHAVHDSEAKMPLIDRDMMTT
ncbi:proprotein convertase subtilisin/kexin type 7 isoform X2 [Hippocampus zosterae]|uniref:proprotein convertase subtilisin/kexin type 7 isoform X2 n=1 Tax=Hippocampus zosterae TaxID=109293 RepID=UPI00223DCFA9|nr:proprotein convertase subtilisin/kexin type 7 isoform X2 [Hippocampus zosterae]